MGVRLIVEVLDYAPASLTPRERYVLIVLAEGARDHTRVCWPGIEDDETFIQRSRLKSRSQRYAVIKALIEKGALDNFQRGQKGVRAGYRIARMAPKGAVLPPAQGPGNQDAENQDAAPQGPGSEHSGSRNPGFRVPETRTPSPQSPQSPHSLDPTTPPVDDPDEDHMTKPTKKKTPAPEHFPITDRMREWAKTRVPDVDIDFETEQFLDTHAAKGNKFVDWTRAWQTWMRNSRRFSEERQQRRGHLRVVGGTRADIPTNDHWDNITDEDLENIL